MNQIATDTSEKIKEQAYRWQELKNEIKKRIVGQDAIIDRILIGLLCGGHILLEGVPGLAKTTLVQTVADALGLQFQRIQFTPDLLPADLIGTLIYNPKIQEFQTKKGPIFANLILADEINRAPAKVQSALLEAMQERQVTIGETTFPLDRPFLVFGTQNPIDQEGTYHLPEAQVDRFMFKVLLTYPNVEQEKKIISRAFNPTNISAILKKDTILETQELAKTVYIDEKVIDYIIALIFATRDPENYKLETIKHLIEYGASPRATLALTHAAKAHAFLRRRHFVIPDDVKAIAPDVLRHRIRLTYEAEAESITTDEVIRKILLTIPSP